MDNFDKYFDAWLNELSEDEQREYVEDMEADNEIMTEHIDDL